MSCNNTFENILTKKKGLVFLFVLLLSVTYQNIFADKPCGKLLGGFSDDCIIIRGKERQRLKPKVDMLLYPGDLIVQERNKEKINFSLSTFAKFIPVHSNAICIDYKPPEKKPQLPKFLKWLNHLETAVHLKKDASSRDINFEDINPKRLFPKPGWRASLFPGESVIFSWESRLARSFIIRDCQGKIVLRKKLNSETSIELNIDEIGLDPFLKYYWGIKVKGITEIRTDYEIKLLDSDIVRIVEFGFEEIEKENPDPTHEKLKKAAFLQFISNLYGSEAELHWKSAQILAEIEKDNLDKQCRKEYQLLLVNYKEQHKKK